MTRTVIEGTRSAGRRLWQSACRAPTLASLLPLLVYLPLAAIIALGTGIVEWQPARLTIGWPLLLLLFPVLPEELFFRGLLIPGSAANRLPHRAIVLSTAAFVLWHPLNAVTINPSARGIFLDPAFLLVVTLLGLACGYSYALSRSIWSPVLIHWLTVTAWVGWLGGRNLALGAG